jgi:hypothetical protein
MPRSPKCDCFNPFLLRHPGRPSPRASSLSSRPPFPPFRFYKLSSELVHAVMAGLDENSVDFSFRCAPGLGGGRLAGLGGGWVGGRLAGWGARWLGGWAAGWGAGCPARDLLKSPPPRCVFYHQPLPFCPPPPPPPSPLLPGCPLRSNVSSSWSPPHPAPSSCWAALAQVRFKRCCCCRRRCSQR